MTDAPALEVHWAAAAVRDLVEIVSYVAADSPLNAQRLLDRLEDRAASLCWQPMRGRVPPELAAVGISSYRELVERPHRIVYHPDPDRVTVLAVFDGRRDLTDVLLDRLLRG